MCIFIYTLSKYFQIYSYLNITFSIQVYSGSYTSCIFVLFNYLISNFICSVHLPHSATHTHKTFYLQRSIFLLQYIFCFFFAGKTIAAHTHTPSQQRTERVCIYRISFVFCNHLCQNTTPHSLSSTPSVRNHTKPKVPIYLLAAQVNSLNKSKRDSQRTHTIRFSNLIVVHKVDLQ